MSRVKRIFLYSFFCIIGSFPQFAWAEGTTYTINNMGVLGLNTIPNARMDKSGTVRVGVSTVDPYIHGFIGFQIATPLYVSLRQTSESSSLFDEPERLYPGVDFKLRLIEESKWSPAVSIGAHSAVGHTRTAGEYIAASKRYKNFDFTAGLGWGRFGSTGHIKNPLGYLSSHFDDQRSLDGENPNGIEDWFTGEDVGFFAGIEYFLPYNGFSIKTDYGGDDYAIETAAGDFDNDAPWSVSLNYSPAEWMNMSVGTQGGESVMGRLSFQGGVKDWPLRGYKNDTPAPLAPHRTDLASHHDIFKTSHADNIRITDSYSDGLYTHTNLDVNPHIPIARQIGRTARYMANNSEESIEALRVTPYNLGLRGPTLTLMRKDLERALIHDQGSANEMWHNASIERDKVTDRSEVIDFLDFDWKLTLDNDLSLSEDDTGVIYRTAALIAAQGYLPYNLMTGTELRFNIKDNLHRLDKIRPESVNPVRNDVDDFTDQTFNLDRAYLGWFKTLDNDIHASVQYGYLEEMYGGIGGEILYRPFGKTYAVGAEAWQVLKRDPESTLGLLGVDQPVFTGHLNGWYEFPNSDLTASLSLGRYLREDVGATAALEKRFDNGAKLRGFVTATDQADFDIFGSQTHLFSGLELSLPLGSLDYIPDGSSVRFDVSPLGRDTGQRLDKPQPLYDVTEPLSYRALTRSWSQVVE